MAALVVSAAGTTASLAFGKQSPVNLTDQAIEVVATPIPHFETAHPERTTFGPLQWRGGLVLTSPSKFFGGWSGLVVDAASATGSERLLAVSDTGVWLTAGLAYEGTRLTGLTNARIGALRDFAGRPFARWRDRDAEGAAPSSGTLEHGEILVSFEQNDRIWRYPVTTEGVGRPTAALRSPEAARHLRFNKSLEAVCLIQTGPARGSVVTFAERGLKKDGSHSGWMRRSANDAAALPAPWRPLSVRPIDGYDLTDCAGLPDGGLLLLERRFRLSYGDPLTGGKMRIRRLSAAELADAQVITGETLVEAARPHAIDNMEGIAVHADARGQTVVTLISDDNFNSLLQKTILLQFTLDAPQAVQGSEQREAR